MALSKKRPIESPSGVGHIIIGGRTLPDVSYSLTVSQEVCVSESFGGGTEETLGSVDVTGTITVPHGQLPTGSDSRFTLVLSDDRQCELSVKSLDVASGAFRVVSAGGEGITGP